MTNIYSIEGGKKKDGEEPPKLPTDPDLIACLEDLLETAKEGYLVELCGIVGWANGAVGSIDIGVSMNAFTTYGALQHNVLEYREHYLVKYEDDTIE